MYAWLDENAAVRPTRLAVVRRHGAIGRYAHDARLAVLMRSNGVSAVLTLNTRDFASFEGIPAIDPHSV